MVERIRRAREEGWSDGQLRDETVGLAAAMLREVQNGRGIGERYRAWKMDRMRADAAGKALTFDLLDQVLRPGSGKRAARCLSQLVARHGLPEYLPWHLRGAVLLASETGPVLPEVVMPVVERSLRRELQSLLGRQRLDGDHLERSVRLSGDVLLGNQEAADALAAHVERLAAVDCSHLSVRVGGVCSRIDVLAYDDSLERIKAALRTLYRAAQMHEAGGRAKLVHLDMGGYRHLRLTMDACREVLEEAEFVKLEAGFTLQAYLPESFPMQRELTDWAAGRVADGGAPVRLRLVKGGNLVLEQIEASRHGWVAAPYESKREVDANFKRMLHHACQPEHAAVVRVGVGSHHLFDVAHALLLRAREGVEERVGLEMLEGMAGEQARVAAGLAGGMSLYSTMAGERKEHALVAEVLRRLDESMAVESFQRDLHGMTVDGERWEEEKARFLEACTGWEGVSCCSRRVQNREVEYPVLDLGVGFRNEALTDWTREENRDWIGRWLDMQREAGPVDVGPGGGAMGREEAEEALSRADAAWWEWQVDVPDRRRLLKEAACSLGRSRGELMAVLVADAGMPVRLADAELCRAVDLTNYYADSLWWPGLGDGVSGQARGVVVVRGTAEGALSTVCGEVMGGLMAGNAVVLVPAPELVLTAWRLAQVLWESGVPRELLQFLPVGDETAMDLVWSDSRVVSVRGRGVNAVGRNAMLITGAADRDQAVRHLVQSAFSHGGQTIGAVSLAIVEGELIDDGMFLEHLRDAVTSLPVGSGWDLSSVVTPLVRDPGTEMRRVLTELAEGERWVLKPESSGDNLWTPGIRTGVRPGGWFAGSACRGPVLGVVRATDFEDGLRLQNAMGGGWVGALQSLDAGEIELWRAKVRVGVGHVNGPVDCPVVRRQAFGAWGRTGFAGGPNHVAGMMAWNEEGLPTVRVELPGWMEKLVAALAEVAGSDGARIEAAAGSYAYWWREEFVVEHDPSPVLGESHVFRYAPMGRVVCRVDGMSLEDVALVCLAARCCGVGVVLSGTNDEMQVVGEAAGCPWVVESEAGLIGRLHGVEVLRVAGVGEHLLEAADGAGVRVEAGAVLANGRLELPRYLSEQTMSEVTHRHGVLR